MNKKLLLGNEAVAYGAYEAGVKVVCSYPGTPSTEIAETLSQFDDVYSEWSPNEKVAYEVGLGASISGLRSLVSMKHVGLNVAADPLFSSSYSGINGGFVIVVCDDPGMHSSQNEQDTRNYAKAAKIPLLEPSDSREAKLFTNIAFEVSEKFDTPVIVRLTTRISHTKSIVELNERKEVSKKGYKKDFKKNVLIPLVARKKHVFVEKRLNNLISFSNEFEYHNLIKNKTEIGIITSGISYEYLSELNLNTSILKLAMIYPFPEKIIKDFCEEHEKIIIIEELDPFIEDYIKSLGYKEKVIGKELFSLCGEYNLEILKKGLSEYFNFNMSDINESSLKLPKRPPVMCPGCPHRGVFYVLSNLGLKVVGDIGCYTLGALPPLESMDTCISMGASVSMSHGFHKSGLKDSVAVIGDSTFMHSGINGLIDIVYNKGSSTIIILDNSITAMTGHQHNPTSGCTIKNTSTKKIDFKKLCGAIGVKEINEVDPYNLKDLKNLIKKGINSDNVSVIIAKRECVLINDKEDESLFIDKSLCKNCKKCLGLGCPAIYSGNGTMKINESLCNGCNLCLDICPFDAIK